MTMKEFFTRSILIIKAKIKKYWNSDFFQWLLERDITFAFLFLSLPLFGYKYNFINFISALGLWIVTKEVFSHVRLIASEFRKK